MSRTYVAPEYQKDGFNCPYCDAYAHQTWYEGCYRSEAISAIGTRPFGVIENCSVSLCQKCGNFAFWIGEKLVYPPLSTTSLPAEDMPTDVQEYFLEARKVVELSPRAAAALLRLALQKLMPHVGGKAR